MLKVALNMSLKLILLVRLLYEENSFNSILRKNSMTKDLAQIHLAIETI